MADTTTELEVLDQIVDVLGGQSGQYETVVPTLQQILALLGGGGGGGGYNPALSVGRADALTGADSTAQWAQRVSTGSGVATVRSVQGATEVQDGELVPVRIAGIRSTDAQGGELGSVEWPTQTLRAAGSVADMLYSDHVDVCVGNITIGADDVTLVEVIAEPNTNGIYSATYKLSNRYNFSPYVSYNNYITIGMCNYDVSDQTSFNSARKPGIAISKLNNRLYVRKTSAFTDASVMAELTANPIQINAALITPTTTPISPALPMTYRVQQGGSEAIIVPDGEVSAAPIITVAEGESAADVVMDALSCIATPDGPTATANHAINTYLTMGGKLYKVTSAIAVGETIVAGTNVTETTVMAELIARTA